MRQVQDPAYLILVTSNVYLPGPVTFRSLIMSIRYLHIKNCRKFEQNTVISGEQTMINFEGLNP